MHYYISKTGKTIKISDDLDTMPADVEFCKPLPWPLSSQGIEQIIDILELCGFEVIVDTSPLRHL